MAKRALLHKDQSRQAARGLLSHSLLDRAKARLGQGGGADEETEGTAVFMPPPEIDYSDEDPELENATLNFDFRPQASREIDMTMATLHVQTPPHQRPRPDQLGDPFYTPDTPYSSSLSPLASKWQPEIKTSFPQAFHHQPWSSDRLQTFRYDENYPFHHRSDIDLDPF